MMRFQIMRFQIMRFQIMRLQIMRFQAAVLVFALGGLWACSDEKLSGLLLPGGPDLPRVVATYPTQSMQNVDGSEPLWILFSTTMDREKTQAAFRLSGGRSSAVGRFEWEGTRLLFLPRATLNGGAEHTLVMGRDAESSSGVDLGEDFVIRFFAGGDQQRPAVVASQPVNGAQGVPADQIITVDFSEAIAIASLVDGVGITPSFIHSLSLSADRRRLTITPAAPLTTGTYTVNLNGALLDDGGNSLSEEVQISFTVGTDFTGPTLTGATIGALGLVDGATVSGAERTDLLTLQFSEPMNRSSVENALSISPPAESQKTWNAGGDTLTLQFTPALDSETIYTASLTDTAQDLAANHLSQPYTFRFLTDGTASLRPRILMIRQENALPPGGIDGAAAAGTYGPPLVDFALVDVSQLIDVDPNPGGDYVIQLRIDFSADVVQSSLASALSFSAILDNSPASVSIHDVQVTGSTARVLIRGAPFPTGPGTPLYRLRIAGGASGLRDTNGNVMKDDALLYLTF